MSKTGDVALIGCGTWGKNLLRNLGERVGMVCDPNEETRDWVFSRWAGGYAVGWGMADALRIPSIKAVVIASPPDKHYTHASLALSAGRHVFVEKPMAMTVEQGEQLAQLAKDKGLVLMVGHLMRYHPGFLRLQRLIEDGELGRLRYLYAVRGKLGGLRREPNVLWSFAPHDISMILALVGRMPAMVQALGGAYLHDGVPDVTATSLDFEGVQANLFVNWLHPYKEQRLVVVGEKGIAVFRDGAGADTLMVYPYEVDNGEPVGDEPKRIGVIKQEPLAREMGHFLTCIDYGDEPVTNAAEGLRVLRVLAAAQEAMEHGGAVFPNMNLGRQSDGPEDTEAMDHTWLPVDWETVGECPPPRIEFHLRRCEPKQDGPGVRIHPLAEVETDDIGDGTTIWRWTHVMPGAKIGRNCMIGQGCFIGRDVVIGDGCRIQNGAQIFEGVTLEDRVFIGPGVVFTNDSYPRAGIRTIPEGTLVKSRASIGANATILSGVVIGEGAMVGAGAVVTKHVEDVSTVVGNPARGTA